MQNKTQNQNENQSSKKEPFSLMTIKTLLAIFLFVGIGTIIIGGGYIVGEYYKNKTANQIAKPVEKAENYYDVLEKKCGNDSCCLSSLDLMRQGNYKEADKNGNCPDGFEMNMQKCETSYQWCELIKAEKISDSNIYRNEELGIEFTYFSDMFKDKLVTKNNQIIYFYPNENIKYISLFTKENDQSIEDAILGIIKNENKVNHG